MIIIPAIDIINGCCVRLSQGNYNEQKVYNTQPLEVAKQFEAAGLTRLHLVDLDGAKAQHIVNLDVLKTISLHTSLHIDFGGGIKSDNDIASAFEAGAQQVTAGSIAVTKPKKVLQWMAEYGAERIILGADVKDEKVATHGWQQSSGLSLWSFLDEYASAGAEYVICTDIAKDGMMQGSSIDLYDKVLERYPHLKLIASGGVCSIEELHSLNNCGLYGAIIGKAIYEGLLSLETLADFNKPKP